MTETDGGNGAWLLCGDRVLASAEIASTRKARRRGLLGRDGIDGALVIERCSSVHTVRMRFAMDVAFLDGDGAIVRLVTLRPWRIANARHATQVVEAEAGSFARWGVGEGDILEVRTGS